jgi:hypothetical protein
MIITTLATALVIAGGARLAAATTITVNTAGPPLSGKCSLTDAVQAAVTNAAVHSCPAGSASATDTIQLAANTTYQNYGKPLVLSGGGPVVIQGPANGDPRNVVIIAPNYGYPSPNPANPDVCPYPPAMMSGSTLTLKDFQLRANQDGTTGICQYAGSLTVSHAIVGDNFCPSNVGFNRGGIWSYPNTAQLHRTLTITSGALITGNYSFYQGGGVALWGNVDTTISLGSLGRPIIGCDTTESSGGGLAWMADGTGKMGNLTITSADFGMNTSYSWGGGLYLAGDDANATVTLNDTTLYQNVASFTGGGAFIGSGLGLNKVTLIHSNFQGDELANDNQQRSLNSDANVYNAVQCKSSSALYFMHGNEWTHNPPLKGDGTCTYP